MPARLNRTTDNGTRLLIDISVEHVACNGSGSVAFKFLRPPDESDSSSQESEKIMACVGCGGEGKKQLRLPIPLIGDIARVTDRFLLQELFGDSWERYSGDAVVIEIIDCDSEDGQLHEMPNGHAYVLAWPRKKSKPRLHAFDISQIHLVWND